MSSFTHYVYRGCSPTLAAKWARLTQIIWWMVQLAACAADYWSIHKVRRLIHILQSEQDAASATTSCRQTKPSCTNVAALVLVVVVFECGSHGIPQLKFPLPLTFVFSFVCCEASTPRFFKNKMGFPPEYIFKQVPRRLFPWQTLQRYHMEVMCLNKWPTMFDLTEFVLNLVKKR